MNSFIMIIGIVSFLTIGILIFILIGKTDQVQQLKSQLNKMMQSFDALDEQAKLIVKTDLELNKAQEELDRRLDGLNALQKTSRLISTTLDEDEIFQRLDQPLMAELGFEKSLLLMYNSARKLTSRIASGFSKEEINYILSHIMNEHEIIAKLREGRSFSSANIPKEQKEKVTQLFEVNHFILSAVLTQDGIIGILFVGNRSGDATITEGDEELISILAYQIGQSLENARLFEQVYRSRQDLEFKIQERTKQLASVLEEVKQISKTKSEFISAVSHELRTPLTSIKGYASLLMSGKLGEIPEAVRDRLDKVNKHSDNLVKLINDLLDISRIESGRVEMKLTEHDIPSIVENVKDLLMPQIKDKGIILSAEVDKNLPNVMIDSSQVERVFINLISNAIKFTPKNGTISVRAQLTGDEIQLKVADTGIGIKEDDLNRLFDEFYRVDNEINQNVKGTGLGLSLAKKIIEAHKGKMWVTSKVNAGTIFYFTIPIVGSTFDNKEKS